LLLVGGGGYTPRNVARAWAHETSIAIGCDKQIDEIIPLHTPYREHFRHDTLFPTLEQILGDLRPNRNTDKKVREIVSFITEQLRFVNAAPSVQSMHIPPDLTAYKEEVEDELNELRQERDDMLRKEKEEGLAVPMEF
jgi:histone deacetylase HOS2